MLITADAVDDARRFRRAHDIVLLYKPVRPAVLRATLGALWTHHTFGAPQPHGCVDSDSMDGIERDHENPDH